MSSKSASTSEGPRAGATGRVVVVATPIGNLGDLSPRAVAALASSDYVYCEDTRRALKLFSHAAISGPRLVSHHRFNEAATTPTAIARAKAGATIAIVTDAGTPLVSDPGAAWYEQPWPRGSLSKPCQALRRPWPPWLCPAWRRSDGASRVSCRVPGASARTAWRPSSGEAERAVVLFESPHRIQRALDDLVAACGPERPVAVCRELTKLHEEVWRVQFGRGRQAFSGASSPAASTSLSSGRPAAELPAGPPSPELGAVGTEPM